MLWTLFAQAADAGTETTEETAAAADTLTESAAEVAPAAQTPADIGSSLTEATNRAGEEVSKVGQGLARGELDTEAIMVLVTQFVLPAVLVLVVLLIAYVIAVFLRKIVGTAVSKRIDETLGKFLGKIVFWAILIFAFLGVLNKFGISIAAFAAVVAAAGFAIALAFQGTLSSFASGIMLLAFRPFKVGQVVNVGGILGKVDEIDLFNTTFDTFDNRRIIMPNATIFGSTIENVSFHAERRVDVAVGVAYDADIDQTREVLNKAAESIEGVIEGEGRGHQVLLLELGASSVDWSVRIWVPAADFWPQKEALIRAVKMHLDEAGLSIPFPQMDVHIDGEIKKSAE